MNLSVIERIQLLGVLPKEGDFSTLKIVRSLQNDLSFSEEEHKTLRFKNAGETYIDQKGKKQTVPEGQTRWMEEVEKDVIIGDKATEIIRNSFKKMNDQKKIPIQMFDLYQKFVKE
jgi:hypothetical protein